MPTATLIAVTTLLPGARRSQAANLVPIDHVGQSTARVRRRAHVPGITTTADRGTPTLRAWRLVTPTPASPGAIELWAEHWNDDPKPFVWHKTVTEVIGT